MSFIDIFAWIMLLVLLATAVAVFVAPGMMPGHTDLRLRRLAAGPNLGLRRCPGQAGVAAMIVVLLVGIFIPMGCAVRFGDCAAQLGADHLFD